MESASHGQKTSVALEVDILTVHHQVCLSLPSGLVCVPFTSRCLTLVPLLFLVQFLTSVLNRLDGKRIVSAKRGSVIRCAERHSQMFATNRFIVKLVGRIIPYMASMGLWTRLWPNVNEVLEGMACHLPTSCISPTMSMSSLIH